MFTLPDAYLLGYATYLLAIFLPGVGVGELLDVWPQGSTIMERLGYSFGIGLALDTLVLLVLTSGLSVAGLTLIGIGLNSIYFLLGLGAVAMAASAFYRHRIALIVRPTRADWILLFVMGALALMETLQFQKYPIFPEYQSADFGNHVRFAQSLISGAQTSIPAGILYFGVHFQLATALILVGGEPLVTLQRTMALLVVLSPMLFYLAAKSLFSRRLAGLVVAALYVFSATVWFVAVFNVGLYPNFFGILAVLFLLVAMVDLTLAVRSPRSWVVFLLALVMAYFSHYTTMTILPALLVLPLFQFFKDRRRVLAYLAPAAVAAIPGLIGAFIFPGLLQRALSLAEAGGGSLTGTTALSSTFQALPVLSNLALTVYDDVGFVFLLLFSAVCLYRGLSSGRILVLAPLVWLLALFAAAPLNISSWRFSYEAVIPLTLMGGAGISVLLPRLNRGSQRKRAWNNFVTVIVLAILLSPMVIGSWGTTATSDAVTDTANSAQAQQDIYTTMAWLKANTSASSGMLSATDWRFTYTNEVIGRPTDLPAAGGCFTDAQQAQRAALQANITYIIVTNVVTCSIPADPQLFLWNTMKPASNLTLAYSNSDVKVFEVV
jgi:hypothetical protein